MVDPNPEEIQPLGNRLLVRALLPGEMPVQKGKIFLPEGQSQDHQSLLQGVVVAVGPDVRDILPGFRILGKRWQKSPIGWGDKMWMTTEDAVECVFAE